MSIEFRSSLLAQLREKLPPRSELTGTLFGSPQGTEIRILNAVPECEQGGSNGHRGEALEGCLQPVGIFSCRMYGEVFLTEADLLQMERANVPLALVIAGDRAGFFVREVDGSLQGILSHKEFRLGNDAPTARPKQPNTRMAAQSTRWFPQLPVPGSLRTAAKLTAKLGARAAVPLKKAARDLPNGQRWRRELDIFLHPPQRHPWIPPMSRWRTIVTLTGVLMAPIAAVAYLQPRISAKRSIPIEVTEASGQLLIRWGGVRLKNANLELIDRGEQIRIPITEQTSAVTYAYRGNDVQVLLKSADATGKSAWSGVRFLARTATADVLAPPFSQGEDSGDLERDVEQLRREANELHQSVQSKRASIEELQQETKRLLTSLGEAH